MGVFMQKQRGFTLIELMIAVAIVGIIAAVAYPNYIKYTQRTYRSEGIALLSDATARMERYYAQNNSYAATLATIGATTTSASGKYVLTFVGTPTATAYKMQVTPQGKQADDACGTLSVDQAGTKASSKYASECWTTAAPTT
jgi:type IV pilus assembly protein PilE